MSTVQEVAKAIELKKYNKDEFDSNSVIDNRNQIRYDFDIVFQTKTTNEWLEFLLAEDVWCSQLNTFDKMVKDPQIKQNQMILENDNTTVVIVKTTGFPVSFS